MKQRQRWVNSENRVNGQDTLENRKKGVAK